jgi:hypothetical protein
MSLLPFFRWCDGTWISVAIRDSRFLFPIIETFHLLGITMLLGILLLLNVRLFNLGMRRQSIDLLAGQLAPWTLGSLGLILISGTLLFLSEALKCYDSGPFQLKMLLLFLAILFQFAVYRPFTMSGKAVITPFRGRLVASLSLMLWFGVGLAGRAIGFF